MIRNKRGPPMRKYCHDCLEFKDNPEDLVNPKYCPECRNARWIIGLKKRKTI